MTLFSRSQSSRFLGVAAVALTALGLAAPAHAALIYQNDFEAGLAAEFSPAPITVAPNSSTKFLGQFSGDGPTGTTLTLTGIGAHDAITLSLDLYIIHSWDGNGNQGSGPDQLKFTADSTTLLDANFANRDGSLQTYSDATPLGGGPFAAKTSADAESTLGYSWFFGTDTTYNLSFTFAHTGDSLVVDFTGIGIQGAGDESWGLDNFRVSTDVVPEPGSLCALGLGALAVLRRRRRS